MVVHPLQHFPLDSINAITKTALPKKHTLFKLLYPHLRFTLALENAVLNFKMSLLHDDKWWKTYAPFPGAYDSIRDLLVEGYRGIHNNDSYPPYTYPRRPPKIFSGYGKFLDAYYETIYNFVLEVVNTIPKGDKHVKNWAIIFMIGCLVSLMVRKFLKEIPLQKSLLILSGTSLSLILSIIITFQKWM